jgi:hypothetical protein
MDYKYLLECKNNLFDFLSSLIIPNIYSGINGMYEYSVNMCKLLDEKHKYNKELVNPGTITIFRLCLSDIPTLNNYEIENEYNNIKQNSGCSTFFDDLVRACFKSQIILLTYNPITEKSNFSSSELYDNIIIKDYIHKCYIEVSNYFKENPELFLKKDKKREIYQIIKDCIEHAIKKSIPNYDEILKEYLKINFEVSKKEDKLSFNNIKEMVNTMISNQKYGGKPNINAIINSVSTNNNEDFEHFINLNKGIINDDKEVINADNKEVINADNKEEHGKKEEDKTKVGGNYESTHNISGQNYILNTQSNINSTIVTSVKNDISKGGGVDNTSGIIDINKKKDIEIDNILNNNPIPEEYSNTSENASMSKIENNNDELTSPIPIRNNKINDLPVINSDNGSSIKRTGKINKNFKQSKQRNEADSFFKLLV